MTQLLPTSILQQREKVDKKKSHPQKNNQNISKNVIEMTTGD